MRVAHSWLKNTESLPLRLDFSIFRGFCLPGSPRPSLPGAVFERTPGWGGRTGPMELGRMLGIIHPSRIDSPFLH